MIELFPSREIVLQLGDLTIRWYGLLYVGAFWFGWWLLPKFARYRGLQMSRDDVSYLTALVVLGVIVGGRLGYVILYEPLYYLTHPIQIFFLNHGGMSAHGGFVGAALALWWVAKKLKIQFWALVDVLVVPATFGLAFGRLGNFINGELYVGYWALVVAAANLLLGLLCWYVLSSCKGKVGRVTALFLLGYGLIRFLNEFVRIDEWSHVWVLTYGQFLTLPILAMGMFLLFWKKKNPIVS